jgi:acyl-CoA thioesterase-1
MTGRAVLITAAVLAALACQRAPVELDASGTPSASAGSNAGTAVGIPRVIFLGDSLTAGFGLPAEDSFPSVLERRLAAEGFPIEMLNAGVSGDTSRGGLNRLSRVLQGAPDVLVVGLGVNDGLRTRPVEDIRENLGEIVRRARDAGARVLLLGVELPTRFGPDDRRDFHDTFLDLAEELDVALVPSMLAGVGGQSHLNLPDGIHPNAAGQRLVAQNVLPHLRELLR